MKDYKQLLKELPSNTIVCALGEFNPPTVGHELLVKTVKVLAEQKGSDHIIFTTPSDLIQEEKKEQFLKLMFPTAKFKTLGESFFSSTVKDLTQKYRKVIIVAGADQFSEFKKLKESANIEIISIGEKDPDSDNDKMKQIATKGLYEDFKKRLPSSIRDIDGRRLMNEMRTGLGLEPVKENLVLVKDKLREKYFKGDIFNVGDIVECNGQQLTIVKRGSNHLLLKEQTGELVSKWIHDVKPTKEKMKLDEAVIQPNGTDKVDPNVPESDTGAKKDPAPKGKQVGFLTFYNYSLKQQNESKQLPVRIDTSHSDDDKDSLADLDQPNQELHVYDPTEVGHTMVPGSEVKGSHHLRRMKIKHHLGESFEAAEKFKAKATAAKKKGNEEAYHTHMSDHHDALVQWHETKGRHNIADIHARKAEEHHNLAMKAIGVVKESVLNPNDPHGDYKAKSKALQDIQMDPHTHKDPELKKALIQRKADLEKEYEPHRIKEDLDESRGHKIIATKLKNLETAKRAFSGEPKKDEKEQPVDQTKLNKPFDPFFKEELEEFDLTDKEIDSMVESVTDDELLELYEEAEIALIYEDTGEEVEHHPEEGQIDLMEVLSRQERIKAKFRLRKTAAKRSRSTKIALRRYSNPQTINKRARRLAIKLMKKRMLRGRNASKISVGEKERIEKLLAKRKDTINRVAAKLVARIRRVEKSRMSHGKVTKGNMPSVF